jgi:hypothetical protein
MVCDSTRAWSTVWLKGINSSFETICVGTADGNVAPFFAKEACGKGDGEDAMVPILVVVCCDSVEYGQQCQATRAGEEIRNL